MQTKQRFSSATIGLTVLLIASLGLNLFLFLTYQNQSQAITNLTDTKQSLENLNTETSSALITASSTAEELELALANLQEDYDELEEDYDKERDRNSEFEDQIRDISKTVGTLDKLAKTDKELLQKYSKVYFLNENYIPSTLAEVPSEYILANRAEQEFHSKALPFLSDMIDEAAEDGVDLRVVSAYRSFDTQAQLKGQYTVSYGSGANAFSADQGYSEHQLGTTVDLTVDAIGGAYTSFNTTDAYTWLQKNAYRYGFVESYPDGNAYYVYEPWHWRFVGEDLARDLHRADAHFYDWDQRKIDEYLVSIFD